MEGSCAGHRVNGTELRGFRSKSTWRTTSGAMYTGVPLRLRSLGSPGQCLPSRTARALSFKCLCTRTTPPKDHIR